MPDFLKDQDGGVCLAVKVQPRAPRNAIGGAAGGELKVKVTAPPVDSAANEALLRLLAETFHCARGAVRLLRGQTSRHKSIRIDGLTAAQALERLQRHWHGES
jgi:hypothetical protein